MEEGLNFLFFVCVSWTQPGGPIMGGRSGERNLRVGRRWESRAGRERHPWTSLSHLVHSTTSRKQSQASRMPPDREESGHLSSKSLSIIISLFSFLNRFRTKAESDVMTPPLSPLSPPPPFVTRCFAAPPCVGTSCLHVCF